MACRVLYCDDRRSERQSFLRLVGRGLAEQIECEVASSHGGVQGRIEGGERFDILITDLNFDQIGGGTKEGLQILRDGRKAWPEVEVVIFTAYPDSLLPEEVLEASEHGLTAETWVRKISDDPADSWGRLREVVATLVRAVEERRGRARRDDVSVEEAAARWAGQSVDALTDEDRCPEFPALVGSSRPMAQLVRRIRRVAPTALAVMVHGERGTGKELVARALHALSGRTGAFIAANCSEFNASILASELFGHERGAFTGAIARREGLFAAAAEGTFFLDEVAELAPESQVQLLRVLESGEYRPVGSQRAERSTARVITSTNRDLVALKRDGRFRADLLARLNRYFLYVPPLRERRADIPALAVSALGSLALQYGRRAASFSEEALIALATAPWPGNVRELESVLVRTLVGLRADAECIGADQLSLERMAPAASEDLLGEILAGRLRLSLPDIAERFGLPKTKRLVEQTMIHFRGLPPDEETRRLFGMSYRNWQHWAYYRGLTWAKVRQKHLR